MHLIAVHFPRRRSLSAARLRKTYQHRTTSSHFSRAQYFLLLGQVETLFCHISASTKSLQFRSADCHTITQCLNSLLLSRVSEKQGFRVTLMKRQRRQRWTTGREYNTLDCNEKEREIHGCRAHKFPNKISSSKASKAGYWLGHRAFVPLLPIFCREKLGWWGRTKTCRWHILRP